MSEPASTCFHCGEALPPGTRLHAVIRGQAQPMCCAGCSAVAELIADVGLEDYYRYRCEPALKPANPSDGKCDQWQQFENATLAKPFVTQHGDQQAVTLIVDGVRCAACGWLIERMLQRVPGITQISVNAATRRARIHWHADRCNLATVLRSLSQFGYQPHLLDADATQQVQDERRQALKRLGVAGLGMMQVMMYVLPLYTHAQTQMDDSVKHFLQIISLLLTTPVLLYSGWPFLLNAARAFRLRGISMDVPVALALVLAYGASVYNTLLQQGEVYFDSVTMFIFFLTLGRYVEMAVRHRTGSLSEALARLQPRSAHRLRDLDAPAQEVPIQDLQLGDVVLVKVGEAVPVDGLIITGGSRLDEALLTGESVPVMRRLGDTVFAGTINMESPLTLRIVALGSNTLLAGVLALLQRTHADKPQLALWADAVARRFLNALLVLALLVGVAWWYVDATQAFAAVLAVLVVTCPCALSLATPAVIAATTTALARCGLLITRADAIERLATLQQMVFDKTGTLTTGQVLLNASEPLASLPIERCLRIAAALEQGADHPIARAFSGHAALAAHHVQVFAGSGVVGEVEGVRYALGTPQLLSILSQRVQGGQDVGVLLGNASGALARFTLGDTLRPAAPAAVAQLLTAGIHSSILSGDAEAAVSSVANACGIAQWASRQTPADKVAAVQRLQQQGMQVAVVGDGINDAPVLSTANVAIAMGNGTALAQVSADAVLMNNSLAVIPQAIDLARRAQRIMRQNLYWAAAYNIAAVPLAALGLIPPWLAALGMSMSSVLVVLNALRMLQPIAAPTNTRDPLRAPAWSPA